MSAASGMAGSRCKNTSSGLCSLPRPRSASSALALIFGSVFLHSVPSTSRFIFYRPSMPGEREGFISNACDKCPRMKFFWLVQGHVFTLTSLCRGITGSWLASLLRGVVPEGKYWGTENEEKGGCWAGWQRRSGYVHS